LALEIMAASRRIKRCFKQPYSPAMRLSRGEMRLLVQRRAVVSVPPNPPNSPLHWRAARDVIG
jgi:hypothetical protein